VKLQALKNRLKRFTVFQAINAWLKSVQVRRRYERTVKMYSSMRTRSDSGQCLSEQARPRLTVVDSRPPRVFFLGTDELQDRGGILQALARSGPLEYFTRSDGSYGQNWPGSACERRKTNSERLTKVFAELHGKGETPDILIAQTWAGYVDPRMLGKIRDEYGTLIVNIAMDDRHQYWGQNVNGEWWGTRGLIPYLDLALTAAPECVDWYRKEGCPALFFPEASDPKIFHPMPELPKIHDVSFVGARYGIREKIVEAIRRAGMRVTAYGADWDGGRLDTKDVPRLFAQSKIVLGVGTVGHSENFYALKMRDFDGPMSGSFYLTHDNPDLYSLYAMGKEIDTYRSIQDCVEKVKAYLADDERRERIAAAGRERASLDHTWDRRFADLLSVLKGTAVVRNGLTQSYES